MEIYRTYLITFNAEPTPDGPLDDPGKIYDPDEFYEYEDAPQEPGPGEQN